MSKFIRVENVLHNTDNINKIVRNESTGAIELHLKIGNVIALKEKDFEKLALELQSI